MIKILREIHKHLNQQQQNIINNPCGQLLIVSGPGTGKTGTLVSLVSEIILSDLARSDQIMAVTFTNRAANEMRERITRDTSTKVYVATLHSFAAQVLHKFPPAGFTTGFRVIDEPRQYAIVNQIKKELSQQEHPAYIIEKLSLACNLRSRETLEELNLNDFYRQYATYKRQHNLMDYDDLLVWCAYVFEKNQVALEYYQKRFSFLLVDEYQDINPVQHTILKLLVPTDGNIVAVGDFDQAIYGFRGADISIMLNFQKDFPKCKTYFLEQNYRSTQVIVSAANNLIGHNKNRKEKPFWTARGEVGRPIVVQSFKDDEEEACRVADVIIEGVERGKKYSDFAVLYRVNILSRVYEEVFSSLGIPYQVFGGPGFFQRHEIQNILALYRMRENPENKQAMTKVASMMKIIKGESYLKIIQSVLEKIILLDNLEDIYDVILETTGYLDHLKLNRSIEGLRRVENVEELRSTLVQFGQTGKSVADFLLLVDQIHSEKNHDAVKLMTSHSAKGAEFDTVFIVGSEEGMFPHYNTETDEQREEERRLFYVSVTRAKNNLFIFHSRLRFNKGKLIRVMPSPFINELRLPKPQNKQKKKSGKQAFVKPDSLDTSTPPLKKDDICQGLLVYHDFFGKGVITKINESPSNFTELDIEFTDGTRKIILEYAPLTSWG